MNEVVLSPAGARRGITVLEALVALVICLLVAGFGVLLITRHRENALREGCKLNLKRIGEAFHTYHDTSSADKGRKTLPPARLADGYATWMVLLAPHLQQNHPLQRWDLQQPYCTQKDDVREARLIHYFCPARSRADTLSQSGDVDAANRFFPGALGDYGSVAGNGAGPDGALVDAEVIERKGDRIVKWQSITGLASLKRGESYTLLAGERQVPPDRFGDAEFGDGSIYNGARPASFSRNVGPGFPLAPRPDAPFKNNFGADHNGVCNFLMADGSVRSFANVTSDQVLGNLARRGE